MTWYLRRFNSWEKGVLPYQMLLNTYVSMYIIPGEIPKDGYVCAPTYHGKFMMAHITQLEENLYQMKDSLGNIMEWSKFETPE